MDGVAGMGGLAVQAHCLSGYSHYLPPQPLAQVSPNTLFPVIQQASNVESMLIVNSKNFSDTL